MITREADRRRRHSVSKHSCGALHRRGGSKPDNEQYEEVRSDGTVSDQRAHRRNVDCARRRIEGRMRMPFTEIVEAGEVSTGAIKEALKLPAVVRGIAHEVVLRPAPTLYGNVHDSEHALSNVLTHQYAADLLSPRPTELPAKPLQYRNRQEQVHSDSP